MFSVARTTRLTGSGISLYKGLMNKQCIKPKFTKVLILIVAYLTGIMSPCGGDIMIFGA